MYRSSVPTQFLVALFVTALLTGQQHISPPESAPADKRAERDILLSPRALAASSAAKTYAELREEFADPAAEYRSMPLWVWNDELEWPRLKQQLSQVREQGMGGVFVHPRPGLMTEYLGKEWFRLWKLSVDEGKRLGILVNIYDENSYPAGFAGGHVPSLAPDTAAQYVQAQLDADPDRLNLRRATAVAAFAVEKTPSGGVRSATRIHDAAEMPADRSLLVFRMRRASGNPWTGEFPYVDLTNPETARTFLSTTYEAYKEHLGDEFGKTIRWAFNDEPLLATGGAYDQTGLALPLSYNTLAEFQKRCGYELADHLPSLFWDVGDYRKVRFDYWQTLHDLWKENYFRPMFLWCDRNNLRFTGHWMEHEWPAPWISPDDASFYAYQHVPGIDLLDSPGQGVNSHILFTIKQVASVAHQLGRRAFSETYGVGGWDAKLEHFKRLGDWMMVHGINFVNQHLSFVTVRGARKRDHPQSFSDVSSWWPYYKLHGDHLGRVSWVLSSGETRHRVLLLEPTTSGFLHARRAGPTPEIEKMRRENAELIQLLADHQIDFDLGDEYIIEWFAKQEGKRLRIARAAYDLLVWPPNMINIRHETLPHLEAYLAAGGEILALSPPAAYVDGRASGQVTALQQRYSSQWHAVSPSDLTVEISKRLKPRVRFEFSVPAGVGFAERFFEDGDRALFFTNTGLEEVTVKAAIEGEALEAWDTISGRISPAWFESDGSGRLRFRLDLPPAGSQLFLVRNQSGPSAPVRAPPSFTDLETIAWKIRPDSPNVIVLDYCDLTVAGEQSRDINTWAANWKIWQAHGFERPAWDNAVQFKTRIFDRNRFPASSGFEARFRFDLADPEAKRGLRLVVEAPELYSVTLNGHELDFSPSVAWIDPHFRTALVEQWARAGENVVRIVGRPFDVRMELENVYLLGNFAVTPGEKGFRLQAPFDLAFGTWTEQGYPFFGDSVLYQTELGVPEGSDRLRVTLGHWEGSVAEILLDGKRVAVLAWPPYAATFPAAAGPHTVGVRVVSTPRNIFGPFHNPDKPRMQAWPAAWARFAEQQPSGSQYDIVDYGLMEKPRIQAVGTGRVKDE